MIQVQRFLLTLCLLLVTSLCPASAGERVEVKIFSGEPRLLIVHGYSTSSNWWAFLQHKIDRYMDGSKTRVVEVQLCNKGVHRSRDG